MRWRRLDVPGHEEARAERTASGWHLTGELDVEEAGVAARIRYVIDCDPEWRTRSALIEGKAGDRLIRFALAADGAGSWTRDGSPVPELSGTLDIDLGFTPATNTLPIRRLALAVGERAPVRSAWLRFPELRLEPLEQTYTREAEQTFRYRALVDGEPFIARLDTDGFGRVLHYEDLWEAELVTSGEEHRQAGRHATVNGLDMYYEIHGSGMPLVLIHGGGSTIQSTFGRILPELAKTHQVIAVELQAHGHTPDRDRPLSFEQDADDVAALLDELRIEKADVFGFSNGGTTALQVAIRHPEVVNRLVLASTTYKRDGLQPGFFEGMRQVSLEHMPQPLKEAYLEANPDPKGLQAMFDRDVARMLNFKDISDADIQGIQAPALVLNGDAEVVRVEHALELARILPNARLAILPCGHGDYIGEICAAEDSRTLRGLVTAMVEGFLNPTA